MRRKGTLRCFKDHRVASSALRPGEAPVVDWTADVDFTSLALDAKAAGLIPLAFMEMGTFLNMGMEHRLGRQQAPPTGFRYLLHPDGLGAQFHVLILGKSIVSEDWTFPHNRLKRLNLQK